MNRTALVVIDVQRAQFEPEPKPHERPKAGRSRPPPAGIKESGKATFP